MGDPKHLDWSISCSGPQVWTRTLDLDLVLVPGIGPGLDLDLNLDLDLVLGLVLDLKPRHLDLFLVLKT